MIKNYIRTALRYFRRSKLTAVINILGLSIGISAALVIFIMVKYDYSFDRFEPGRERIYRVVTDGDGWKNQGVPVPFPEALKQNTGGVETVASLFDYNDWNTKVTIPESAGKPDKQLKKQLGIAFADSAFKNPYNLVLTESRAKLYFPGVAIDQVIGRTVTFSDTVRTTVTGVVADLATNSDFDRQCFISLPTVYHTSLKKAYQAEQWGSTNSDNQVLVKLSPNVQAATVNREIKSIFKMRFSWICHYSN